MVRRRSPFLGPGPFSGAFAVSFREGNGKNLSNQLILFRYPISKVVPFFNTPKTSNFPQMFVATKSKTSCFLRPKPKGRVAANFTVWETQGIGDMKSQKRLRCPGKPAFENTCVKNLLEKEGVRTQLCFFLLVGFVKI